MVVEFNNFTNWVVSEKFIKEVAKMVLKGEKAERNYYLSIALVGQKRIRSLNKKYLKKNLSTDVLAFPGEIVICPQEVQNNAKKYNSNFKKELALVLIHGILHIFGYNHQKSKAETIKMNKRQDYYLSLIKF